MKGDQNVKGAKIFPYSAQLSKCLNSRQLGGGGGIKLIKLFEFEQRHNKTYACTAVHRMARLNHLID